MATEIERLVAEVEVKTTKALAAIKKWKREVRKELRELVKESVQLALDTEKAEKEAEKFRRELERQKAVRLKVEADTKKAEADLERLKKQKRKPVKVPVETDLKGISDSLYEELGVKPKAIKVPVGSDTTEAKNDLATLSKELRELDQTVTDIDYDSDPERALSHVQMVSAELENLSAQTANVDVDVNDVKALVKLERFNAKLKKLDATLVDAEIRLSGAIQVAAEAKAAGEAIDEVGDQAAQTERRTDSLSRSLLKLGVTFGAAAIGAKAMQSLIKRAVGIRALEKSNKELREELTKVAVSTEALKQSMDRLSRSTVKASLGVRLAHGALNAFTRGAIIASLVAAGLSGALALLGVAAAALAAEVVALVAVLTAALGAALIGLGGMFLGAAAGAGVLMLAFKGLKDATDPASKSMQAALDSLMADFQALSKTVRAELVGPFTEAVGVIRTRLMPTLQRGLGAIAAGMGVAITNLTAALNSTSFLSNLTKLFTGLQPVIGQVAKILVSVANGFLRIFASAVPTIQAFSGYFVNLATRFDAWTQRIANDGRLNEFLSVGVEGFRLLIEGTLKWGGAIMRVLQLAAPLGLKLMGVFVAAGERLETWSKSAEGTLKITEFFKVMEPVITSLSELLKGLGKGIMDIIMAVAPMVPPIVDALTTQVVPALRDALKLLAPVGLQLIGALAPLVPLLMPVVEVLADLAGYFITAFEPVLRAIITAMGQLAPVLGEIVKAFSYAGAIVSALIDPLVTVGLTVGPALADMFARLGPVIVTAVDALAPLAGDLLIAATNAVIAFVDALIPVIPQLQELGERLFPVLTSVVQQLTPYIDDIVGAFISIGIPLLNFAVRALELADNLGILAPVIGTVVLALGAMKIPGITALLVGLAKIIMFTVVPAFASFAATLLANPITWIVLAIAGLIAAVVLLYQKWQPFRDFVDGLWQSLQALWDAITKLAVAIWHGIYDAFKAVLPYLEKAWDIFSKFYIEPIIVAFKTLGKILSGDFSGALETVSEYLSSVGGMLGSLKDMVLDALRNAAGWLVEKGKDIVGGLLNGARTGIEAYFRFYRELPGKILSFIGNALNWLVDTGTDIVAGLVNGLFAANAAVGRFFIQLPGRLLGYAGDALNWLVDTGTDIIAGLVNGLFNGLVAVISFARSLPQRITSFITGAGTWLLNTGVTILRGLRDGIVSGYATVVSFFRELPGRIVSFFVNAYNWVINEGKNLIIGFRNGIIERWNAVVSFFRELPGKVRDFFVKAKDWLVNAGRDLLTGLWNGIQRAGDWFREKFINFLNALIPDQFESVFKISSPSRLMATYGMYIVQGLGQGIDSNQPAVITPMRSLIQGMDAVIRMHTPPPLATPAVPLTQLNAGLALMETTVKTRAGQITSQFGSTLSNGILTAATTAQANATTTGANLGIGLYNGLAAQSGNVYSAAWTIGNNIPANMDRGAGNASPSRLTFATGQNAVIGLYNGMAKESGSIFGLASTIGTGIVDTTATALQSNSPSLLMQQQGSYAGEGFFLGVESWLEPIKSLGGQIVDFFANVGSGIVNSFANAFGAIGGLFSGGDKVKGLGTLLSGIITLPVGGIGAPLFASAYDAVRPQRPPTPPPVKRPPLTKLPPGVNVPGYRSADEQAMKMEEFFGIKQKPGAAATGSTPMIDPMGGLAAAEVPISSGVLDAANKEIDKSVQDFFAILNFLLNNRSSFTMPWDAANQLAAGLAAAGYSTKRVGQNAIRITHPDGRYFTAVGAPGTVPELKIAPLVRPILGQAFSTAEVVVPPGVRQFTAPQVGNTMAAPFLRIGGDLPPGGTGPLGTAPRITAPPPITGPAAGAGAQNIVAELRGIRAEIATVKQPLIGEIKQTITTETPTDVELARAAVRASALVGGR